ncbi:hypothetical protein NIES22_54550 [Calothrix brevissima NIES-22]|nr:hypothetical protein NIES22_54550 [Calothrix brevissima NIES-22]
MSNDKPLLLYAQIEGQSQEDDWQNSLSVVYQQHFTGSYIREREPILVSLS